jgi:predicted lipoprotein with Yx(FWY)xxD motif
MFNLRNVKGLVFLALALLVATPAMAQQATQAPTPAPTAAATQPAPVVPDAVNISVGSTKEFSKYLVGKDGLTLYMYPLDGVNQSTCYDQCATAWPPLLVKSTDGIKVADGIPGKIDTAARKDGTLQVTYNGQPLYYWFKDKKSGDTTGNRVGRVWWVVSPATVSIAYDQKLGQMLIGPNGMTLYQFTKDTPGASTCTDKCATSWPPLTVKSAADIVPGVNLPGKFDVLTRADGTLQVTYNGVALYYWNKDQKIGDTTGDAVGKVWYIVAPETVVAANTTALGTFLTTADGMTLYTFANDTANTSTCTGDCLKAWPAFTTNGLDRLTIGKGLTGKLDTIKRDDGKLQLTYNGLPLYLYKSDKVPGDTTGQGVGNVWTVAKG